MILHAPPPATINISSFSFFKVNEVRKEMQKMEEGGELWKIGRTKCEDSVVLMDREGNVTVKGRVVSC